MRIPFLSLAWMALLAAPAWAADNSSATCTATDLPLRPIMATHTQAPYPPVSVMTGEEGSTLVKVSIGADGVPTDVSVAKSSGSLRLDQAAVDHIKADWRWNAPVKSCKPQAAQTEVNVTWNLQNAAPTLMQAVYMQASDYPTDALKLGEQGAATIGIAVAADGTVSQIQVFQSSGFPDLDARAMELARGWHWVPANLNGRTLATVIYFRAVWRIADKK
ncbi:MAG TPA: energy transducer TonB [Rhizomicrobium sp.]|jgi:protein TonB